MSRGKFDFELHVNVRRKRVEGVFTTDKPVNVDDKQPPLDVLLIFTMERSR